jgi:hypothetical protein
MSAFYNYKDGNNLDDIENINEYFEATTPSKKIEFIVKNNKNSEDHNIKSSILYVEPLSKRFSLFGFYNFRDGISSNKNFSTDPKNIRIDSLSLNYRNNTLFNRVGTSANYSHNGISLSLGGAFQSLIIEGISEIKVDSIVKLTPKPYNNFIPYFAANLDLPKNVFINATYSYDVNEPSISYLFPMPNLRNTMYKILGNPNLTPERYHEIDGRISYWNRASMVNLSLSGNAKFYENQIVYNQTINQENVTTSTPENLEGGNSFSTNFWTSFPLIKTKLTMNLSCRGDLSNSPVLINKIENNTNSKSYGASLGLTLTLGQKLSFTAGSNISQTFTTYSIQANRNQNYINYGANAGGKWQVLKKTFLEANYRFSNYTNRSFNFNQNIHNLNVSVRQIVGKKNQWELRLAAMDILNQNEYIRHIAQENYIESRVAPTLARYFLLTAAYNLKGFDVKQDTNRRIIVRSN